MISFDNILNLIAGTSGTAGLVLAGTTVALLIAELWIWLTRYARIPKYRNRRRAEPTTVDGISVVVVLGDDFDYLENTVPKIMAQQFPDLELVIMEVATSPEFSDEVQAARERYTNLVSARIDPDPRFRISDKTIYNIGIKTARYDSVILTTADAAPSSTHWLECMAKGFGNGEVVIGYCGVMAARGFGNAVMRCDRLMSAVRYLSSAVAGRPYRGILCNLGISRELYLESRGFNHLNMTVGEDDLFVQKVATRANTSVVMNHNATIRQSEWGGMRTWWRKRRLGELTREFYPRRAMWAVGAELIVRTLFMLAVVACAVFMPLYTALGAAGLWLVRLFVVRHQIARISRRLGERRLSTRMMLWDVAEPFAAAVVRLSIMIKPPREVWK